MTEGQTFGHTERQPIPGGFYFWFFLLGVVFLLLPQVLPVYLTITMVDYLLFGMFAMSLGFLISYVGLICFGHAAFFGIGAYVASLSLGCALCVWPEGLSHSIWVVLLLALGASAIYGIIVGVFSIRARGIYFAILTLAFAEALYRWVFYSYDLLGGADGRHGLAQPGPVLPGVAATSLEHHNNRYYVVVLMLFVSFWLLRKLVNSPFGSVLQAIRENEERARFLGYNVERYKLIAFVISGLIAGAAGALYAPHRSFAGPELLAFQQSGEVVMMVLLGGLGSLAGPILGGVFLTWFEDTMSAFWSEGYLMLVGGMIVLLVLFAPRGLAGLLSHIAHSARSLVEQRGFRNQRSG